MAVSYYKIANITLQMSSFNYVIYLQCSSSLDDGFGTFDAGK